ncbi:SRPBCC family protein [uncultured Jannaschia sp.]|uniref:SRPBCC family protein n=1 Tax=uncultured Jannaschia sp. TaxID=293347 RepID=UPI00261A2F1D|nr:SRPBCC family protein [uncultured Jannaschia sp.]
MERDERYIMRDPPERRIYPVTVPEHRGDFWRNRGISPATGVAVGVGVAALAALAGMAYIRNRPDTPRPPDDAEPRFREGGAWKGRFAVAGKSILIGKPRAEVYAYFRDLSNQPKFMENLRTVRAEGTRSHWTFAGAFGQEIEVEVELTDDRENERLAYASVPGSPIEMRGEVTFRDAPAGRGTYVEFDLVYVPPAGAAGRAVANLVRRSPQQQLRHGLKRLKMLMEAGEVATSANRKENA